MSGFNGSIAVLKRFGSHSICIAIRLLMISIPQNSFQTGSLEVPTLLCESSSDCAIFQIPDHWLNAIANIRLRQTKADCILGIVLMYELAK
jgi:hypothetical protein